jgi:hypothetical protein|tara:strand:- start:44 stop:238 length:195 start_codon:yes stop_codon:yes gene_type:complete
LGERIFFSLNLYKGNFMATYDLRSTQKSYKPKPAEDYKTPVEDLELRMDSIEQALNTILKKLDN